MQQQQAGSFSYSTKWDDLAPAVQSKLIEVHSEVMRYKDDCEKLDREPRLKGQE